MSSVKNLTTQKFKVQEDLNKYANNAWNSEEFAMAMMLSFHILNALYVY